MAEAKLMRSDTMATCEVHRRLDGDLTPKRVKHCGWCDAWICEDCWVSVRRIRAAFRMGGGISDARN